MEIDENKKIIIDNSNAYEPYNNGALVIIDKKMDFQILNNLKKKGFSIKGQFFPKHEYKIIKNYNIESVKPLDTDVHDNNMDLKIGPLGEEEIGMEEYILPSERKCVILSCESIENI
ncbi:hypothetical protein [Methanobrevibacter filiformis]|uniref:Uncharacterized protein n=1 Tax=Methanobrevibacter filiformis TaxID=55758 RepID=A0A166FEG3_9EURY|nr:hypothetical protein [Methanobrevibacter filiformis]KZX17591.1 hypothetical protein MBFIL_00760 [Methanobrevibacter filiformis]